jgi:hypothetical protein
MDKSDSFGTTVYETTYKNNESNLRSNSYKYQIKDKDSRLNLVKLTKLVTTNDIIFENSESESNSNSYSRRDSPISEANSIYKTNPMSSKSNEKIDTPDISNNDDEFMEINKILESKPKSLKINYNYFHTQ